MWKRSHGRTSEAPPDERGGYRYVRPTATASHLDSTRAPLRCGIKVSTTGDAAVTRSRKDTTPQRAEHSAHERDINHRDLVDDQQIAIERRVLVAPKTAGPRIGFE